jgi:chemotaxis protein methyltransferase CheR
MLSLHLFNAFRELIFKECAISLSDQKRLMLSVRISKRLRSLGEASFEAYWDYVKTPAGQSEELKHLIDVVTTNKTDFFRENHHFEYLTQEILPRLAPMLAAEKKPLRVWSAGCATGEEPYTLAFVLADYFKDQTDRFRILATDVSTDALRKAVRAIYSDDAIEPVSKRMRQKYLLRGDGEWRGHWRVTPKIRKTVQFGYLNFNDDDFGIEEMMHLIFCRNVIIYFSQETKKRVAQKLFRHLLCGGLLFVGHSETLHQLGNQYEPVERTVYLKRC